MIITPDVRSIEVFEAPTALERARRGAVERRRGDVALARTLLEVHRKRAYVFEGCASAVQFGRRLGLAEPETRMLLDLARVLELDPSIEERLLRGDLTTAAAAAIRPLLADPRLRDEHGAWLDCAARDSITNLRRGVRRRLAELRCGEPVVEVNVQVPESVAEAFHRARHIASEKAQRPLSRSEAFEAVVDHYLDSFDPARQAEGTRRVGPTSERPCDRYIPISVRRAIRRRAGDTCEYPGCPHRGFLQFAHWRPHRDGSAREEDDLLLLCRIHHLLVDARFFAILGSPRDPRFICPTGIVADRGCPGGRGPETDAERAAVRELARRHGESPDP